MAQILRGLSYPGVNIYIKMAVMCHSTGQNETQKSRLTTENNLSRNVNWVGFRKESERFISQIIVFLKFPKIILKCTFSSKTTPKIWDFSPNSTFKSGFCPNFDLKIWFLPEFRPKDLDLAQIGPPQKLTLPR